LLVISAFVVMAVTTWALVTRSGSTSQATGRAFWVAVDGQDSASGSQADPWRTIQHAASSVPPGAIVYVRSGVYHESVNAEVSGNATDGPVVFRNAPGEHPVVDGTGLTAPSDFHGLFSIDSQSYVTIQGFEI